MPVLLAPSPVLDGQIQLFSHDTGWSKTYKPHFGYNVSGRSKDKPSRQRGNVTRHVLQPYAETCRQCGNVTRHVLQLDAEPAGSVGV